MPTTSIWCVQFPGSNSDQDCIHAVESMGHEAYYIWHKDTDLGGVHARLGARRIFLRRLPAGSAIARLSPVMHAVAQFAEAGGLVMGICNGFQILCEAGLLPGALIRNRSLQFRSNSSILKVMHDQSPLTQCTPDGTPSAHSHCSRRGLPLCRRKDPG